LYVETARRRAVASRRGPSACNLGECLSQRARHANDPRQDPPSTLCTAVQRGDFQGNSQEEGPRTFQAHDLLTFHSFALIQDLKPQGTRARLTAIPDGKRRNARSLASTATVEQGSKTEDDSVEKTDRFKVSRRKARPPISPQ
ncbi:hypothetical protein A4X09_0g7848, partial [Tilletia walkeri]